MPSLSTIRTVTIRQVSEGADTVRRDLEGLVATQERVAQASEKTATVTEASARRIGSATSAYDKVRSSVDPLYRAQLQLEQQTNKLFSAFQRGGTDLTGHTATLGLLQNRYDSVANASERLAAAEIARARAEQAASTSQFDINRLLGVDRVSSGSARASALIFEEAAKEREAAEALLTARREFIATARAQQDALTAQFDINGRLGVDGGGKSARASAAVFEEAFREEERQQKRLLDLRAAGARNESQGWRALGAQGSGALANIEASRRLGSLGPTGVPANQNRAEFSKAQQANLLNLAQQAPDVFGSLYGGISPLTTFIQQGPQIAQSFAGPGALSMSNVFQAATEKASALASRIGVVGGALGVLTVAVGAGAIAWLNYRSEQAEVEKRLTGFGRLSGVTRASLSEMSTSAAAAGMSRTTAREVGSIYAGTGRVGPELLGNAVSGNRDFAAFLGVDASEGATVLAGALADVSKGAGDLASRYGLLNAATVESIQRMEAQGDRLGATRRLMDEVRASTRGLAEETTGWGKATEWVSDRWSALGQGIDKALTGGNLDERLASARDRLDQVRSEASSAMFEFGSGYNVQDEEKNVDRLSKLVEARERVTAQANQALRSQQIASAVRSLDPEGQEFKRLTDTVQLLRKAITDPMKFGLDSAALAETEAAFGRVGRLAQTMRQDIEKYGSTAVADLNRKADFEARTVGATPYGRSAATVMEQFDREARLKSVDLTGGRSVADVEAGYRNRNTDFNVDQEGLFRSYQEELRTAREREGLLAARDKELTSLRRTESLSLVPQGAAFARLNPDLQQQFLQNGAMQPFATIPAAIAAAVAQAESSGNLNTRFSRSLGEDGRPSTAYGLGQITAGTSADAVRRGFLPEGFDRTDTSTMVQGIFGVLAMKLRDAGGDMTKALENYRGSSDPAVNRAYAAARMRDAGMMGDASELGVVRDQDANARAVKAANESLRLNTDLYGRNGAQLEVQTRATEQYNSMLARGVSTTDAAAVAFGGLTDKLVSIERAGRLVQFGRDDDFARAQLGRDRIDQQAYARARQLVGDTSTLPAQGVIDRTRDTINLTETKSLFSDGITSFVSDLRRGGDAMTAFSNVTGNVIDKLAGKAIDSLVSGAFGQLTGGASGSSPVGSFFSSIFGGAHANGGLLYGPGGPRSDSMLIAASPGEYVINAASVEHYGRGVFDNLNSRSASRFADGGMVGWGYSAEDVRGIVRNAPAANTNAPPSITFVTPPGMNLEADGPPQRRADGSYEQVLKTMEKGLAGRASNSRGPFQQAVGGAWAREG